MKYSLIVINILVVFTYNCVYGQDTDVVPIDSSAISASEENVYVKKQKKERHYPKLQAAQEKYLHWIDKRHREFPFGVPAIAYNKYDGVQVGAALINLKQPVKNVDFTASLLYGIKSKKVNGTVNIDYYIKPKKSVVSEIKPSLRFQSFSYYNYVKPLKYYAIHPEISIAFNHRTEKLQQLEHRLKFTSHVIMHKDIAYHAIDSVTVELKDTLTHYYVNVLNYTFKRNDKNFPFEASMTFEQSKNFVKTYFEANSFIRYQLKDYNTGVHLRFFIGGFLWRNDNYRFRLYPDVGMSLNGKRGEQDYLYNDNYFGRNEQANFAGRQITKTDGFFKVSTPLNAIEIGQTADWLMAFNFKIDFPIKYVPIKLFFDLAYSFDNHLNPINLLPMKGFQYDGGVMFSFFDEGFEIYLPLFYSKEYKTYYKANAPKFGQRISFLFDLHKIELHKKIRGMKF